ncbi:MAG: sensor histidine kinase [Solirubrobacteraceae bacterium]
MSPYTTQAQLEELRASCARILTAADAERRQLERDLNNGPEQSLIVIGLRLGLVAAQIAADPASAIAMIEELRGELSRSLTELRELRHQIHPPALACDGLPAALRDAATHSAISVGLECDCSRRYPREIEAVVYFCCLEGLTHAGKPSDETPDPHIRIQERDGVLEFEVADRQRTLAQADPLTASSIQQMTDRIGALGGTLSTGAAAGHGFKLIGSIPIPDQSTSVR